MARVSPDYRFLRAMAKKEPRTDLEKKVVEYVSSGDSEEFNYAKSIYTSEQKKEILEAFLLTGASTPEIASSLDMPEHVIDTYTLAFFDPAVFKDKLDIEEYIETYPSEYGRSLKLCAMTLGVRFLKFRYGYEETEIDIAAILKSVIESANILASAAKINPLNSNTSKEARHWMLTTIKAIETFAKIGPKLALDEDEWQLVLKNIDSQEASEGNPVVPPEDLVH